MKIKSVYFKEKVNPLRMAVVHSGKKTDVDMATKRRTEQGVSIEHKDGRIFIDIDGRLVSYPDSWAALEYAPTEKKADPRPKRKLKIDNVTPKPRAPEPAGDALASASTPPDGLNLRDSHAPWLPRDKAD